MRRGRVETCWRKAAVIAAGLLLAVAAMLAVEAAEGTPEPQTVTSVAPRPSKW